MISVLFLRTIYDLLINFNGRLMKVSYNWLKDYVEFDETPEQLAIKLTETGFEVEELYPAIKEFSNVVVGIIESVEKHPFADKLSICKVNNGKESYQVICGAPNVATGQTVPFAKVGAILPGNFKIKKAKIRGIESFGMICSKEELGLEKSSEGIWAIDEKIKAGTNFAEVLKNKKDYIFDLAITPNRPDCLSMIGVAREIAAITGKKLKHPKIDFKEETHSDVNDYITVNIIDKIGCPRYACRVIKNVKIGPSPEWMELKLESVGVRPINNIVDITNFVLMEYGHPLHAFDLSEISGAEINVRKSRKNERFTTLDDKERELPENTVMICDKKKTVAIGGIMGGQNSEVTNATVDILLEGAYFDPRHIAKSSRGLGLTTEASQRFERGADPNGVIMAIDRAAGLMAELASGKVIKGICDEYPKKIEPQKVSFRPARVNHLLGSSLSYKKIIDTIKSIELDFVDNHVIAPTFRVDLKQEADIIEEVARLIGYSNLPTLKTTQINYSIEQSPLENYLNFIRRNVLELGINEAVTISMLKSTEALFFREGEPITILNPISDDMTTMRPSLIPGLLKAVSYNLNRNQSNIRFFEIGRIFKNYKANELPDQPYSLCVMMTGNRITLNWDSSEDQIDFYEIKGYLEAFLQKIFLDNFQLFLYDKSSYFDNRETILIRVKEREIGFCGKIGTDITKAFDINKSVYAFVLDLNILMDLINTSRSFKPISKFPYVEKDIALVLEKSILAGDVLEAIKKTAGNLLQSVEIFDIFEGGNIAGDRKSLAIRMRFQSEERTLNDAEVDVIFRNVITQTTKIFNATLRN
jgi:phenylalanyl-tRNA synthetase beta chain